MRNARVTQRNWYRLRISCEYFYNDFCVACCFLSFRQYFLLFFFVFQLITILFWRSFSSSLQLFFWVFFLICGWFNSWRVKNEKKNTEIYSSTPLNHNGIRSQTITFYKSCVHSAWCVFTIFFGVRGVEYNIFDLRDKTRWSSLKC